ncbi:MAG: Lrp/AsnC family transcriptional regulator [Candidatus Bathyarchaeia archaeon]|jgi:DNA-binding Lrp family transcriptional regulator
MKDVDNEILHELVNNPQAPFSLIAKKLNIAQNTVKKKYEKMVYEKIILHSFITIDLLKIGYQGRARITIKTEQKTLTIEALKKIPNVVLVAETIGDYDIIVLAVIKDYQDMLRTTDEIKKVPTISQADVSLEKITHFPVNLQFNKLSW